MLQIILDTIAEGVIVSDGDGTIIFKNRQAEELGHFELFELDQTTPVPLEDYPLALALKGNEVDHRQLFARAEKAPNGLYLCKTARPLRESNGRLCGAVAVFREFSHLGGISSERSEFAAKMATLGELAGGIAHEINSPVGAILLSAEAMLDSLPESSADVDVTQLRRYADTILRTSLRIGKIVKSLRSFSRDTENDPYTRCRIVDLLSDTVEMVNYTFKYLGVRLTVDVAGVEDLEIECRPGEVGQVIANLLKNAAEAVEKLDEKWVEVRVSEKVESVEISVTDSGDGIPASVREKMFHPFFTTKAADKGTGLGLPISRSIIERHGGRMDIDACCPKTRFVVSLPKNNATPTPKAA